MNDDTKVEIVITGEVDESVAGSLSSVMEQVAALVVAMSGMEQQGSAGGARVANTFDEVGRKAHTAAGAAEGLHLDTEAVIDGVVRLGEEAVTGNFSKMPETLLNLVTRSGALMEAIKDIGPASIAGFGAAAVAAAGFVSWLVEDTIKANELHEAIEHGAARGSGGWAASTTKGIGDLAQALDKVPGIATNAANKYATDLGSIKGVNDRVLGQIPDVLRAVALATDDNMGHAEEKLRDFLSEPSRHGDFLTQIHASAQAMDEFAKAAEKGDASKMLQIGMKALADNVGQVATEANKAAPNLALMKREAETSAESLAGEYGATAEMLKQADAEATKAFGDAQRQRVNTFAQALQGANEMGKQIPPTLEEIELQLEQNDNASKLSHAQKLQQDVEDIDNIRKLVFAERGGADELEGIDRLRAAKEAELSALTYAAGVRASKQLLTQQKKDIEEHTRDLNREAAEVDTTVDHILNTWGKYAEDYTRDQVSAAQSAVKAQDEVAENAQRVAQQNYQYGRISADELLGVDLATEAARYNANEQLLTKVKALAAAYPALWRQINKELEDGETDHQKRMDAIQRGALQERLQQWEGFNSAVNSLAGSLTSDLFNHDQSITQIGKQFLQELLTSYVQYYIRRKLMALETSMEERAIQEASDAVQKEGIFSGAADWVTAEFTKTAATESGTAVRTATTVAAAETSQATEAAANSKSIIGSAYTAAAAVFKDVASMGPYGWILAPFAAAAAFAAVMAFDVVSAEGGAERIGADGQVAILHKNEAVLPARIAMPLMTLVSSSAAMANIGAIARGDAGRIPQALLNETHPAQTRDSAQSDVAVLTAQTDANASLRALRPVASSDAASNDTAQTAVQADTIRVSAALLGEIRAARAAGTAHNNAALAAGSVARTVPVSLSGPISSGSADIANRSEAPGGFFSTAIQDMADVIRRPGPLQDRASSGRGGDTYVIQALDTSDFRAFLGKSANRRAMADIARDRHRAGERV